jgi:predicted NAD/FAD-binding protein
MHQGLALDNGQHILIGAYRDTLQLLNTVGVAIQDSLWRMPLHLHNLAGHGVSLPHLPAPWNLLTGILSAQGWSWPDKLNLLLAAALWQRQGFRCDPALTVAEICQGLRPRVMAQLIEPLCVSALNLPSHQASAQVFLTVLHDAVWTGQGSSDMLLPKVDLGRLMPDAAHAWLSVHGAEVHTHQRVDAIEPWLDHPVLLACPPWEAARLTQSLAPEWSAMAAGLSHTAISTVYVRTQQPTDWPHPLLALDENIQAPAQFAFDKGRLSTDPDMKGVLALVVSASSTDRDKLSSQVLQQVHDQLGLHDATLITTVVEKRATFACVPALVRPPMQVCKGVLACGDYVAGPYPATLEAAVRSGFAAIDGLTQE